MGLLISRNHCFRLSSCWSPDGHGTFAHNGPQWLLVIATLHDAMHTPQTEDHMVWGRFLPMFMLVHYSTQSGPWERPLGFVFPQPNGSFSQSSRRLPGLSPKRTTICNNQEDSSEGKTDCMTFLTTECSSSALLECRTRHLRRLQIPASPFF